MKNRLPSMSGRFKGKQKSWIGAVISSLLIGLVFFITAFSNVSTEIYDMEPFSTAEKTIRAPITIENKQQTERSIREAVQAVEDRYSISGETTEERITYINELFSALEKLEKEEKPIKKSEQADIQEKTEAWRNILSEPLAEALSPETLQPIAEASESQRLLGKELLVTSIYETMNAGVKIEEVATARRDSKQNIKYSSLNADLKDSLNSISDFAIVENAFIDPEKTLEARKQAAGNIEPVMIRAGEVVVQKGQTITSEKYDEMELLGLLNQDRNFYPLIGLGLYSLLISAAIAFFLITVNDKKRINPGEVIAITLISILMIGILKVVSLFMTPVSTYFLLVPAATGVILLKLLFNDRFAYMMAAVYALIGGILFNAEIPGSMSMEAAVYFFFSQAVAVTLLRNIKDRLAILKAGIGIAFINWMTMLVFTFFSFEKYNLSELAWNSGFTILSAFLSCVLALGLLPFFETSFNILSDTKLLTLSNPNHPLLRKILMEASGTYHHSLMVANLSEVACEAVGANGLLARVAAYYHDIGKTLNPKFFIENQMGMQNPHDRIMPIQSAGIIISHPYDGAEILRKHKLPQEIIDIAEQHHGTTLLKYFYYKEKELNPLVSEEQFRYPGPVPQTKEAAIVCICDSVEAAVRSMKEPTKEKIAKLVSSIIQDRTGDGQLDDTSLTFKELSKIQKAICETLSGVFHSRIEYPEKAEDLVKEAN